MGQVYAGISMIVGVVALLTFLALWNQSYSELSSNAAQDGFRSLTPLRPVWTRLMFYLWPFIIVITLIRAG